MDVRRKEGVLLPASGGIPALACEVLTQSTVTRRLAGRVCNRTFICRRGLNSMHFCPTLESRGNRSLGLFGQGKGLLRAS